MVSGGKTTICDYSVLFSLVIYREKTARSDFEQEPSRSTGELDKSRVNETKWIRLLHTKRYESYQLIRMVCVGIMVYQSSSLPSFFFPPITPYYYLSISLSPFHEIDKLFHVPTPRWCNNR
nr:MAG TPA: hypothetical protein [Caudoviricetes sp.]